MCFEKPENKIPYTMRTNQAKRFTLKTAGQDQSSDNMWSLWK